MSSTFSLYMNPAQLCPSDVMLVTKLFKASYRRWWKSKPNTTMLFAGINLQACLSSKPQTFSPWVSGTSPPGEIVSVEIEYIMELKHNAQALRFIIPTAIAPRYGDPPPNLHIPCPVANGISISVKTTMLGHIQFVEVTQVPWAVVNLAYMPVSNNSLCHILFMSGLVVTHMTMSTSTHGLLMLLLSTIL